MDCILTVSNHIIHDKVYYIRRPYNSCTYSPPYLFLRISCCSGPEGVKLALNQSVAANDNAHSSFTCGDPHAPVSERCAAVNPTESPVLLFGMPLCHPRLRDVQVHSLLRGTMKMSPPSSMAVTLEEHVHGLNRLVLNASMNKRRGRPPLIHCHQMVVLEKKRNA
jgi:hypothetical protein